MNPQFLKEIISTNDKHEVTFILVFVFFFFYSKNHSIKLTDTYTNYSPERLYRKTDKLIWEKKNTRVLVLHKQTTRYCYKEI